MKIEFPEKLSFLFESARYKILFGGRGGAKSWGVADALLITGAQKPTRVLCAREIQKSMKESVHQLLQDRITALGLSDFYEVLNDEVRGKNGSLILFTGLKHNINNIKSKEAVDIVWVEEANTVSKKSWDTLIPTIRKPGSEIWVSFNPELETDETYQRFVVNRPPEVIDGKRYSFIVQINYTDNPWFPNELRIEMERLKESSFDDYLTIYEGKPRQWLDGAIYANEIRKATIEDRVTKVPYDTSKPVLTFWDLGESDMTAIWFAQRVGLSWHIIDYYENSGHKLEHYLKELRSRPYLYDTVWLPHDAENSTLGQANTISAQTKAAGFNVRIVPKGTVANGINSARNIFDQCWFDQAKTADGLNCLRHYQYKVDPETSQRSKEPLHNWASHGADAFRYFATAIKESAPKSKLTVKPRFYAESGLGWMG